MEISQLRQQELSEVFAPPFPADYFRTIQLKLPRGSGHTTAALELARRYPGTLILVPTEAIAKRIVKTLRESGQEAPLPLDHKLPDDVKGYYLTHINSQWVGSQAFLSPPLVIVDPASMVSRKQIDDLQSFLHTKHILLIG